MMIKFRAWDKVQNKMLLPDNIEFINGQAYWAEASTDGNGGYSNDGKVDGIGALFELEQFTGLKDVNGKDIYEGDILEVTIDGTVQADKYLVKNVWDPHVWTEESDGYYAVSKMEVQGNVHENPELSEADK
ncbi:YopX family protein [Lactiplantibacillus pentosus]|uniref:YopX family protein n=1 Tax=Lactiplantibacillus pentosus TaxID=1589 RepID=UPI001CDAA3ED|nr:YopX family protein [Lactiplantibacillus pentosus]